MKHQIKKLKCRGQVWISDLVFSIILFSLAAVFAFSILMNAFSEQNEFSLVLDDASRISEFVMSEGTLAEWNQTNYIRPGMLSAGQLNSTKAGWAMELSETSYSALKSAYNAENDFAIIIQNRSGEIIPFSGYCAYGKQDEISDYENATGGCNSTRFESLQHTDLAKVIRFVAFNGDIVKITVYTWD